MKWYIDGYDKQLMFITFTHFIYFTALSSIHYDDNIV